MSDRDDNLQKKDLTAGESAVAGINALPTEEEYEALEQEYGSLWPTT